MVEDCWGASLGGGGGHRGAAKGLKTLTLFRTKDALNYLPCTGPQAYHPLFVWRAVHNGCVGLSN